MAPATCGEAIEVPLLVAVPPPIPAERMVTPGAASATGAGFGPLVLPLPQFDHYDQLSASLVAVTVITASSNAAGTANSASAPSLPAATANTTPAWAALQIAS